MSKELTQTEVRDLFEDGILAARQAVQTYHRDVLKGQDQMPCGFGWVEIYGVRANSKIGKVFDEYKCRKSSTKAHVVWNPGQYFGQNVSCVYEGAKAFAQVFKAAGFEAYACDRMD
jgi:hypothetical protein